MVPIFHYSIIPVLYCSRFINMVRINPLHNRYRLSINFEAGWIAKRSVMPPGVDIHPGDVRHRTEIQPV